MKALFANTAGAGSGGVREALPPPLEGEPEPGELESPDEGGPVPVVGVGEPGVLVSVVEVGEPGLMFGVVLLLSPPQAVNTVPGTREEKSGRLLLKIKGAITLLFVDVTP